MTLEIAAKKAEDQINIAKKYAEVVLSNITNDQKKTITDKAETAKDLIKNVVNSNKVIKYKSDIADNGTFRIDLRDLTESPEYAIEKAKQEVVEMIESVRPKTSNDYYDIEVVRVQNPIDAQLLADNNQLRLDVAALRAQLALRTQELAAANATIAQLRQQLATSNADNLRLQQQLATALADLATARQDLLAAHQALAAEQQAHAATQQALVAEQQAHAATQQALVAEQQAHAATQASNNALIAQLQADIANRDATIAQLQADIANRDATIAQLQANIATKDALIAQLQSDVATTNRLITDLQTAVAQLTNQNPLVNAVEKKLADNTQQLTAALATNQFNSDEIKRLLDENKQLRDELDNTVKAARDALAAAEAQRDKLNAEIARLRQQLAEERSANATLQQQIADLKGQIAANELKLQQPILPSSNEFDDDINKVVQGYEQKIRVLTAEFDTQTAQISEQYDAKMNELKQECEAIVSQIDGESQQLITNFNEFKLANEKIKAQNKTKITQLETKLQTIEQEHKTKIDQLVKEHEDATAKALLNHTNALNDLKNNYIEHIADLNRQLTSNQGQIDTMSSKIRDLTARIASQPADNTAALQATIDQLELDKGNLTREMRQIQSINEQRNIELSAAQHQLNAIGQINVAEYKDLITENTRLKAQLAEMQSRMTSYDETIKTLTLLNNTDTIHKAAADLLLTNVDQIGATNITDDNYGRVFRFIKEEQKHKLAHPSLELYDDISAQYKPRIPELIARGIIGVNPNPVVGRGEHATYGGDASNAGNTACVASATVLLGYSFQLSIMIILIVVLLFCVGYLLYNQHSIVNITT